jgi:hypothetical protein
MALWDAPAGKTGKWLWQGSRVSKLWEDSIAAMGLATDGLDRLGNRTDKYYVPNHGGEADLAPALDSAVALAESLVLYAGAAPPRI